MNPFEPAQRDKKCILIVDDEESILQLFNIVLADALPDVEINLARNGAEAVDCFCLKRPCLLMMDLHMPVMDGQAAFMSIEKMCTDQHWAMPSVVFCTGFAPPDTVKRIVNENTMHCLLTKPVRNEVLAEVIRARLNKS